MLCTHRSVIYYQLGSFSGEIYDRLQSYQGLCNAITSERIISFKFVVSNYMT